MPFKKNGAESFFIKQISMLIEICASSYKSAINAEKGGAHRIELCENLSVGGLTPSYDLIEKVVTDLTIPTYVLIRPRGGDFVYSDAEMDQMRSAIRYCKSIGCNGIVSGVLTRDNTIDVEKTRSLIELSKPLVFTFHRAFDEVSDPYDALESLVELGADRILTSGQAKTASDGLKTLIRLKDRSTGRLVILVGGNVRSANGLEFKEAGFSEIHSSALVDSKHSDLNEIKQLITLLTD